GGDDRLTAGLLRPTEEPEVDEGANRALQRGGERHGAAGVGGLEHEARGGLDQPLMDRLDHAQRRERPRAERPAERGLAGDARRANLVAELDAHEVLGPDRHLAHLVGAPQELAARRRAAARLPDRGDLAGEPEQATVAAGEQANDRRTGGAP